METRACIFGNIFRLLLEPPNIFQLYKIIKATIKNKLKHLITNIKLLFCGICFKEF